MRLKFGSNQGVTLIELMLAMVIISFILMLGFGFYQRSRTETDFSIVKYNVDGLFQTLKYFYHNL